MSSRTKKKKTYPPNYREQLFNEGKIGPIENIQVSTERIVQIRGILYDLDPPLYQRGPLIKRLKNDPRDFYKSTAKTWLSHHPLLDKAEVRCTGTGLRAISWLKEPVVIDNAKVRIGATINSTVIEANCTAPHISLRILGVTKNYTRPNDLLWFITMNNTQASPDLVSRGVPIRFYFDGHPGERDFGNRDPTTFAKQYRAELLGELAGMIDRWTQQGRPAGSRRHRISQWASIVGAFCLRTAFRSF